MDYSMFMELLEMRNYVSWMLHTGCKEDIIQYHISQTAMWVDFFLGLIFWSCLPTGFLRRQARHGHFTLYIAKRLV